MDPKEQLKKVKSQIKTLALKSELSDAEAKELKDLMVKAEQLGNQIKALEIAGEVEDEETATRQAEIDVAVDKAVKAYVAALPVTNPGGITVTKDEADQPFSSDGEYFMAVKMAALRPSDEDVRLKALKASGLSEGVPADGGYLLQPQAAGGILERMYRVGSLLSGVAVDRIGPNSNSMVYNAIDETSRAAGGSRYGGVLGYWLAEAGTKTASKPAFRQMELKLKKVAALCYATDELLSDAVALESWLNRTVPEELRFQVEDAIFEGDGIGKPLGIMNSPCLVSVLRIDANEIDATDIANMWSRRWVGVNDYVWLANQDIFPQINNLVIGNFPLFMPAGGIGNSPNASIFGKPIIEIEYAATLGTTGDLMLASLSQYQTIQKGGIEAASSIHVQFLTDETAYRFVYRIDGQPIWDSALTPFKGSNTQSPFVVLTSASA